MRLEPGFRFWTYAVLATLAATGAVWLIADFFKDPDGELLQMIAADMMMLHGMMAMMALILIGAMIPLHVQRSWRAGKNRVSGAVMIGTNAVLAVTAWGLYYAGSDLLRTFVADVHIAAGLALPALVIAHVVLGRRSRTRRHLAANPAPDEIGAVFQAVTFSTVDNGGNSSGNATGPVHRRKIDSVHPHGPDPANQIPVDQIGTGRRWPQ